MTHASVPTRDLHALAWGDLPPVPWVHLDLTMRRTVSFSSIEAEFRAQVDAHEYEPPFAKGERVSRPGCSVMWRFALTDHDAKRSGDADAFLSTHARDAFRVMSFGLREHDPRIGEVLEGGQVKDLLRRSPLFDPPRVRPPAWKGNAGLDAAPCPFCQDGFGSGYPAMWGGGNLLWVHPSCWMRAHG